MSDYMYPTWQCTCGTLNRFLDTFAEICKQCGEDHTLDWRTLIVDPKVREAWRERQV